LRPCRVALSWAAVSARVLAQGQRVSNCLESQDFVEEL
jgi:hypothetical protein